MDQVPLPSVVDQDIMYEANGSKSVWISQPGNGLDKRQCTLQICIRPTDDQPVKPAVIFRGKGHISTFEHNSYDKRVDIYWQRRGWMNGEVAKEWLKKTFAPAVDKTRENVLFLNNLSSQCTEEFHTISRKEANTLVYPLPLSSTNKVQPIDTGEGYMMKKLIGDQLDRHLENDKNLEVWSGVGYSASERRIMITKWVGAAWSKMKKYQGF